MLGRMYLISPTERPAPIKALGRFSSLPEKYGCDIFWVANGKKCGVQRKELKDFIASVIDGRLYLELAQMKSLDYGCVVIEGEATWSEDDQLMGKQYGGRWTYAQHYGAIWSLQTLGACVAFTRNAQQTAKTVETFRNWSAKTDHDSFGRRPGPQSLWGKPTNRDNRKHIYMGFPTVGPKVATAMVDHGTPLLGWKIPQEELADIVGVKRAEKLWQILK